MICHEKDNLSCQAAVCTWLTDWRTDWLNNKYRIIQKIIFSDQYKTALSKDNGKNDVTIIIVMSFFV